MPDHDWKYHPGSSDAWQLWEDTFGTGSDNYGKEVILILDDDRVILGKVTSTCEAWVQIQTGRSTWKCEHIDWGTIRFMAYEGFPVRKILCAPQPKAMRKVRSLGRAARIRRGLKEEFDGTFRGTDIAESLRYLVDYVLEQAHRFKADARDFVVRKKPEPRGMTFGDPFCAEFAHATLLNPGNHGPWYDDEPNEETLVLDAENGERALLWDLPSVLAVE